MDRDATSEWLNQWSVVEWRPRVLPGSNPGNWKRQLLDRRRQHMAERAEPGRMAGPVELRGRLWGASGDLVYLSKRRLWLWCVHNSRYGGNADRRDADARWTVGVLVPQCREPAHDHKCDRVSCA